MKSSVEKIPRMLELLSRKECSPNNIAKKIDSDIRTVNRLLDVTTEMGIVKCESLEVEGRKYRACRLDPEYHKIYKNRRYKDE